MSTTSLQLRSLITSAGQLELSLAAVPLEELAADEVRVRIEAAPLNPSDLGLLFGAADMSTARSTGTFEEPSVVADVPERAMKAMAARIDVSMPVGNEGAGTVVEAGESAEAQALMGKTVAILGGAMYAQHRTMPARECMVLPEGTAARDGASAFVNPLTALGMVETMRMEGHSALVHTAAASNLGQMLNRVCIADGIPLVNIVRKPEQAELLREQGATYVCDSSTETFMADLTEALVSTGATIAFDATGGGRLAGQILTCMEAAISRTASEYSRYGSMTHKQVYLYGSLDTRPTELNRNFGMAWGIGGWLLFPFMQKIGRDGVQALKDRVAAELTTTFASTYVAEISLNEALQLKTIEQYNKRATGAKYLLNPAMGQD